MPASPHSNIRTLFISIVCSFVMAAPALVCAQEPFSPPAIETFDGKNWGGMTIGQSTTDDIKRAVKTSKGAVRPEAMLLPQPEKSGIRIDILMHGRGGMSVLQGFRVAYSEGAPTLNELAEKLRLEPEISYARIRFDEWAVAAFPERGIVAFVEGTGRAARVDVILLCTPSRVQDAVSGCTARPGRISDVRDEFPDDRRSLEIGKIRVDISTVKGLSIKDRSDIERDLQKRVARIRTPREIDIVDSATGTMNIDVQVHWKDKKAKVEVRADISGKTLLGAVSVTADGSDSIREDRDNAEWRGASNLENTVFDVVDRVYRRAADKVRSQRPPTPAELRTADWNLRINRATP